MEKKDIQPQKLNMIHIACAKTNRDSFYGRKNHYFIANDRSGKNISILLGPLDTPLKVEKGKGTKLVKISQER